MTTTPAPAPATPHRSRRVIAISLVIIAALVVAFFVFANLYTDWLWYEQLGFAGVLTTQWFARIAMFAIGFVGMALPVWLCIQLAYRLRPVYARLSSQLDRYQEVVEPLRRLAMWGIPIFFGFFAGFAASTQWETTAMWLHGTSTDVTDPQFHLDTGFYMFAMPFYSAVLGFTSAVLLICLLVTAVVSYLYGSVRIGQRELRISKAARIQFAVLAGVYLLVQAVSLWLDRYKTMVSDNGLITGPGYTEANAVIPGQMILAIIAAIVAVLFFVTAVIGHWRFPLIATALLVVSAIVVGMAYPWVVNVVQVKPNQLTLEAEYYQRNIDATKTAYGLDDLQTTNFAAKTDATKGQLRADADTTAQIRIMDPAIIGPTVQQLEQYRSYYQFKNPLDVDRYQMGDTSQDTVVSVRELNLGALGSNATWQNTTQIYTHGYGLVVAKGNARTSDGKPVFLERGIPTTGFLGKDFEPRVYFGESSPTYSIVGAPAGSAPLELDYLSGAEGTNEVKTTFSGDGGPNIGSWFNRLVYALKFQSEQILFSDSINEKSQILYDRKPVDRVKKAAPYLTLDGDPYPTVVDGHIVWVVDGYTTSADYPYSHTTGFAKAIADSTNPTPTLAGLDDINYIRNSVKATVDAYDGHVTLYAWDADDPVLKTWEKIYPATVEPLSKMSGELMSHVRYPTDLFKVQRSVLGTYHVDDASSFYRSDNKWVTPPDPQNKDELQPPYYLTMKMPGQDASEYSMFTSFIPASDADSESSRNVLMGYLAVDSNAGTDTGKKRAGYGKLRMLEISADTPVPGPGQVQNNFDAQPSVSSFINLLKQGQSQVLPGNLLTLPVGGGLLYVQPVFVQSSGATKLPTLQKVLVAFGDKVAFEDTLGEALDKLFGGDSGAATGDQNVTPTPTPTPGETQKPGQGGGTGTGVETSVEFQAALQEAKQAMTDRQAAMEKGDWAAYGAADARLTAALDKLLQLSGDQ